MPVVNYHTVNGQMVGQSTGTEFTQYLTDALGSVTATVNGKRVTNTYRYKPYGERLAKTGAGPDPAFQWAGDTGSWVTGRSWAEQYNQARHYGTRQSSWTSVDPIWPTGWPYSYVEGNPATLKDPAGLSSCGNPVNDSCRPQPREVECCTPKIQCFSSPGGRFDGSRANFHMALPKKPTRTLVHGTLSVYIYYYIQYQPSESKANCPQPELQVRTLTLRATSGLRGYQAQNVQWRGAAQSGWCIGNHGPIPPSSAVRNPYSIVTACMGTTREQSASMTQGNENYKFYISEEYVRLAGCPGNPTRGNFRIHPDGGNNGSQGCISFPDQSTSHNFRSCMSWARAYGCSNIPLYVGYTSG